MGKDDKENLLDGKWKFGSMASFSGLYFLALLGSGQASSSGCLLISSICFALSFPCLAGMTLLLSEKSFGRNLEKNKILKTPNKWKRVYAAISSYSFLFGLIFLAFHFSLWIGFAFLASTIVTSFFLST